MPKFSDSHVDRALVIAAIAALLGFPAASLYGQQNEIPPAPAAETGATAPAVADDSDRIVDGRPKLYSLKRGLHPRHRVEAGFFRPILGLGEKIGFEKYGTAKADHVPRVSGIKFAIRGMGSGSGFGPEIKPFHRNLFDKGIEIEAPMLMTYRFYHSGQLIMNFPLYSGTGIDRVGLE